MGGRIPEQFVHDAAGSGIRRAVETGTYTGDSTVILAEAFDHVETIELSRKIAVRSWLRLRQFPNVRLRVGDSANLLRPSIEPTFYWLDGHWSGEGTAGSNHQCPLLAEIRATSPGTSGDRYLIDDARLFTGGSLDPQLDPGHWPTIADIERTVAACRPGYQVTVHDELDVIAVAPLAV